MTTTDIVLLANHDTDYGHVPARTARSEARKLADTEGVTIAIRCPISDRTLRVVKPRRR